MKFGLKKALSKNPYFVSLAAEQDGGIPDLARLNQEQALKAFKRLCLSVWRLFHEDRMSVRREKGITA